MTKIVTNHPFAFESLDFQDPKGAKQDNTHHKGFVRRVEQIFEKKVVHMDWGCAGGGLVRDFLEYGHESYGVEGSDAPLKHQLGEWPVYPDHFFTADLTKPFHLEDDDGQVIKCDIITSWEVMEHIHDHDLDQFFQNLHTSLKPGGWFVCSVAEFEDRGYHVTLKPYDWWHDRFSGAGFEVLEIGEYFGINHMVRQSSFYFAMKKPL